MISILVTIICYGTTLEPSALLARQDKAAPEQKRAWLKAFTPFNLAKSLYVKELEGDKKSLREFWYLKPNRLRVEHGGMLVEVCDDKTHLFRDGMWKWKRKPALKNFLHVDWPSGFEPFFSADWLKVDLDGSDPFTYGDRKWDAVYIETSASPLFYGRTYYDAKTFRPLGHTTEERNEITLHSWTETYTLNPKIPTSKFVVPRRNPPD